MISELVSPILVLVVGYLIKLAAKALKIELADEVYNSIVAGIVVWLLTLLGVAGGEQAGLW